MGALDVQGRAQGAERGDDGREIVGQTVRERGRGAEARQVHGDHVVLGGEYLHDRVPGLSVVADAVQEQQGLTGARARVGDRRGARAAGRRDVEGHLCGHDCSCPRRGATVPQIVRHVVSNNYRSVASTSRGGAPPPFSPGQPISRGLGWSGGQRQRDRCLRRTPSRPDGRRLPHARPGGRRGGRRPGGLAPLVRRRPRPSARTPRLLGARRQRGSPSTACATCSPGARPTWGPGSPSPM
ncbi:hypothetical protein SALBM135S_10180 [Streptomyces alboniger]